MPDGSSTPPRSDRPLPAHVTMPLLERVRISAVDDEYAEHARARAGEGSAPRPPSRRGVTVVALLLLGLLVATAFVQNVRFAEQEETNRSALVERIEQERTSVSRLQRGVGELQAEVTRLDREDDRLTARLRDGRAREERLGLSAGFVPARGPGVRITVDDSPSGDPLEAVRDEDLAMLTDALWGAGAEAIAINGKRLTVLSPIRNSGNAIHVNSRPLSPPYVVEAIGDPDTLQSDLLASERGNAWIGMAEQLGFRWRMQNVQGITLPAARVRDPVYAVEGLGGRVEKEVTP